MTDNDLAIIMSASLEAAKALSTAATRPNVGHLRNIYLDGMKSAMVAAEQARQMAGRPTQTSDFDGAKDA